ncbi:Uncharacterized protein APZ42_010195, partial [Daphnia magna]
SADDRAKAVFDLDNCFRCLGHNHLCRECKKSLRCKVCNNASHNTLIHGASRAAPGHQSPPQVEADSVHPPSDANQTPKQRRREDMTLVGLLFHRMYASSCTTAQTSCQP